MKPTALVVSTVHWPDDTRIRERLIRSLARDFNVEYATGAPGPTDRSDLRYIELRGSRIRRNLEALWISLRRDWDVLVLHDPELIITGLLGRLVRRKPVVLDVHEDYPAVARVREWIPGLMRVPLAKLVQMGLRVAERFLTVTLAEPGYRSMFSGEHSVFPNYPNTAVYPPPRQGRLGAAVYVGDITSTRGVDLAAEACAERGIPLRLIGRSSPAMKAMLSKFDEVQMEGVLPNDEAIARLSECAVGLVPLRDVPNYRDSQPTKLLEYLAVGLPVVATDLPGTRQLVEGLEAVLLVPPGDIQAMGAAISQARSPQFRQLAIRQAQEVREKFRWPDNEVRAFYTSLVNQ